MKYILANWKMYLTLEQSLLLFSRLDKAIPDHNSTVVILFPSVSALWALNNQIKKLTDSNKFKLGVQNIYFQDEGAYTGEISAPMVKKLASYVLVGHSERRIYFHETDEIVAKKLQAVLRNQMIPVLCIGENAMEKAQHQTKRVIADQLNQALSLVSAAEAARLIIAYEPVWAIGSGNFASFLEVEEVIEQIREICSDIFGQEGQKVKVLYGGSVEPENAKAYLKLKNCDGLLVGTASLNYQKFANIVKNAAQL